MERILIDGPTGVIGMSLIQYCIVNHTQVVALCHKNSKRTVQIPKHPLVTVVEADLSDYREMADIFKRRKAGKGIKAVETEGTRRHSDHAAWETLKPGYDAFYHFAWNGTFGDTRNDMALQVQNIQYSLDAVELAEALDCKCFIGAGSQAEYGRVEGVLRPDTPPFPENGYGMAKLCAGAMTRQMCESRGIRHVWTRILSVYGCHDGAYTMIMSALDRMSRGEETAFTPGEQQWDYLNGRDAARAMYLIGERGVSGKTYVLGSGKARPLREYLEILARETHYERQPGFGRLPYASKQVMHLCADLTDLTRDTGFVPEVSFEEGIKELIAWKRGQEGRMLL
ncbi:MAG: NAD(P)-dependent oxidoreductase [Clostridium sp.]|nr:NAD(P)-dependent oxidoreductase [Clostridium sp.]